MLFFFLFVSILWIVFSSVKWKIHPFLSLTIASFLFGIMVNFSSVLSGNSQPAIENLVLVYSQGFGSLLSNIGLVIIFGVLLGKVLEKSGAAEVMALKTLSFLGVHRASWAMSILGWIISIPVFCDSGYILLSSFKKSLSKVSGVPLAVLSIALATGLYASHTFVPPTPGPLVAAANVGISPQNLIWVILMGGVVSFVAMLVGSWFAQKWVPKLLKITSWSSHVSPSKKTTLNSESSLSLSFFRATFPMAFPLGLIALGSILAFPTISQSSIHKNILLSFQFLGHPLVALMLGFALAYKLFSQKLGGAQVWVKEALQEASLILLINGAGGGFGAVIKASPLSELIKNQFSSGHLSPIMGLWLFFLIAALLKTSQGSSTASLVITSSIAVSLLDLFGLSAVESSMIPYGPVLSVMAMGAGAMVVSHVNDSYFWVVTQFTELNTLEGYKSLSLATLIQGVVAMLFVSLLAFLIL